MSQGDKALQEIVIIRRSGGEEAPHKGGAWKIAYADFVTAMMAFFLVMWLINSANEVTKARVASYFNPIKMTDAAPLRRGLKEKTDSQNPSTQSDPLEEKEKSANESNQSKTDAGAVGTLSETALLLNPYAALDELVKRSGDLSKTGLFEGNTAEAGDPFNPRAYTKLQNEVGSETAESSGNTKVSDPSAKLSEDVTPEPDRGSSPASVELNKAESASSLKQAIAAETQKLADELQKEVETRVAGLKDQIDLGVRVEVTDEGVLLVLEDGSGKSMFAIGSAQPNPALIEIISGIGGLLSARDGAVIVRGHTDGRLFRNRKYDNWQLSTDRAHMASYMLVRGGFPESRVMRIEGYGSSKPVMENEFMLDANRRVEFLVTE
jgi:chemotaxis protein MotB